MNKKIAIVFAGLGILVIAGAIWTMRSVPLPAIFQVVFETRREGNDVVLYKISRQGEKEISEKTGLKVTYDWNPDFIVDIHIVVSPDQKLAVFNKWSESHYGQVIYVSNIDGSNMRQIAKQEAPEGNGELNDETIRWVDEVNITYKENSIICEADCGTEPSSRETIYQVNTITEQKTILSQKDL